MRYILEIECPNKEIAKGIGITIINRHKLINQFKIREKPKTEVEDIKEIFGEPLLPEKRTMDDEYQDGSPHQVCEKCGFCKECNDCDKFGCKEPKTEVEEWYLFLNIVDVFQASVCFVFS